MTIANTKTQLLHVLSDSDNKVVALTGKWGTGNMHLVFLKKDVEFIGLRSFD